MPTSFLIEAIAADEFDAKFVYKKYAAKSKFENIPSLDISKTLKLVLERSTNFVFPSLFLFSAIEFLKASMFARTWAKAYIPEESFTP